MRSGEIWVEGSRRYADPDSYLIPLDKWPVLRGEVCRLIKAPLNGEERLREKQAELEEQLLQIDEKLSGGGNIRLDDNRVVLTPLEAEELPESAIQLKEIFKEHLPLVDLIPLMIEIDRRAGFSKHFTHAGGNTETRDKEFLAYLYAAIISQACNLGPTLMARISGLKVEKLIWFTNWYIREETLKPANTELVNTQHHIPISQHWGGGTLSSSGGQRFPVAVKTNNAVALPRYFGYGR